MRFHYGGLDIKLFYLILNINLNINLNFCMGIKRPASLNSFRSHRERAGPQCTIDLSQIYWLSCVDSGNLTIFSYPFIFETAPAQYI